MRAIPRLVSAPSLFSGFESIKASDNTKTPSNTEQLFFLERNFFLFLLKPLFVILRLGITGYEALSWVFNLGLSSIIRPQSF